MIYIFGDSYCEPDEKNQNFKKWYEQVGPVKNFGKCGTGPEYSFEFFHEVLINDIKKKDKIVFVLSSSHRAKFPLKDVTKSYLSSNVLTDKIEHWEIQKHKENIKFYFETRGSNIIFDNLKNLFYLKNISNIFDIKIYTFLVYHLSSVMKKTFVERDFSDNIDYSLFLKQDLKNYDTFLSNVRIDNTENFKFYPIPLSKISYLQFLNSDFNSFDELDLTLSNHLTEKNHNILARYINDLEELHFDVSNIKHGGINFVYD